MTGFATQAVATPYGTARHSYENLVTEQTLAAARFQGSVWWASHGG